MARRRVTSVDRSEPPCVGSSRHRTRAGRPPPSCARRRETTDRRSARDRSCRTAPARSGSRGAETRTWRRLRAPGARRTRRRSRASPARAPARCWRPSGRPCGRRRRAVVPSRRRRTRSRWRCLWRGRRPPRWRRARPPAPRPRGRRNAAADSRRSTRSPRREILARGRIARSSPRHSGARARPSCPNRRRNRHSPRRSRPAARNRRPDEQAFWADPTDQRIFLSLATSSGRSCGWRGGVTPRSTKTRSSRAPQNRHDGTVDSACDISRETPRYFVA